MIGEQLLNYKILSLIGEGGMGKVFLAEDINLHKKVAIKSLLPQFVSDANLRARFIQDAKIVSELNHPNIVRLLHYHEDESGLYLILEYVEGIQLDDYILNVKGIIPYQEAKDIMNQLLSGLSYAHARKIIHRDIKPSNILIDNNHQVKIIDFGIAKMLDSDENLAKTMTSQEIGTPRYMSPEQILGKHVSIQTDIYSAGLVLYEMLTGKCPYGEITTIYALNKKIVEEILPPPSDVYPFIPKILDQLVMRSIDKDAENRFETCDEFMRALEDAAATSLDTQSVHIQVKNAKKPVILFGKSGTIATESVFEFAPDVSYKLIVCEEGKKTIQQDVKFGKANKTEKIELVLENLPASQGTSSKSLNLVLIIAGIIILGLFSGVMYLNKEHKKIESKNKSLEQELNYLHRDM